MWAGFWGTTKTGLGKFFGFLGISRKEPKTLINDSLSKKVKEKDWGFFRNPKKAVIRILGPLRTGIVMHPPFGGLMRRERGFMHLGKPLENNTQEPRIPLI